MQKYRSDDVYVGRGIYLGDLEMFHGCFIQKVYKKTNTRLFIKTNDDTLGECWFDPQKSTYCTQIINQQKLSKYISDLPESLTTKEIKVISKNLNGSWLDIEGKTTFKKALENRALEI